MSSSTFTRRLESLQSATREAGLSAVVLNPGATFHYVTGLDFHLMERPVLLVVPAEGQARVLLPELEVLKLAEAPFEVQSVPYGEDPGTWPSKAAHALEGISGRIGGETRGLRFLETRLIAAGAPTTTLVPADEVVARVRGVKDEAELKHLREAVRIAEQALEETLKSIREGITEKELAAELIAQLRAGGSEEPFPFPPIVAFGEHSADPHAAPTDRPLRQDEIILIDWGARSGGYASDLTRVFSFGTLSDELQRVASIVEQANLRAQAVAGPGTPAGAVDEAARNTITEKGYGSYFTHRTGHGLGLETHEEPYIRAGNDAVLEAGQVFTIEPGIYLEGKGGVRIEDDILITKDGIEVLSSLPRGLRSVG